MRAVPRSPAAARQQDEIADPATSRGTCGGVSAVWQCGGKSDSMDILMILNLLSGRVHWFLMPFYRPSSLTIHISKFYFLSDN